MLSSIVKMLDEYTDIKHSTHIRAERVHVRPCLCVC